MEKKTLVEKLDALQVQMGFKHRTQVADALGWKKSRYQRYITGNYSKNVMPLNYYDHFINTFHGEGDPEITTEQLDELFMEDCEKTPVNPKTDFPSGFMESLSGMISGYFGENHEMLTRDDGIYALDMSAPLEDGDTAFAISVGPTERKDHEFKVHKVAGTLYLQEGNLQIPLTAISGNKYRVLGKLAMKVSVY